MTRLKKAVSLLLAFALVFGSMSALSFAVMNDGNFNTLVLTQKFFRETTGSNVPEEQNWVETTKVAPGDKVRVRLFFGSDFNIGTGSVTYFFDKDVLEPNFSTYPIPSGDLRNPPINTGDPDVENDTQAERYTAKKCQLACYTGAFDPELYPDADAPGLPPTLYDIAWLVVDGYIEDPYAYFDEYGTIHMTLAGNNNYNETSCHFDVNEWLYELDFTVKSTATVDDEIRFLVNPDTIRSASGNPYGTIDMPRFDESGTQTNCDAIDMDAWDCDLVTTPATATIDNTITFDAGEGTFEGGSSTSTSTGVIKTALASAPTLATNPAGQRFVGWVPSTVENPTADDVVTTFTYDYEALTYNALYESAAVTLTFDSGTSTFSDTTTTRTLSGLPGEALDASAIESALTVPVGQVFDGWSPVLPTTFPSEAATYTAQWRNATDVAYTMTTYTMGLDGEYVASVETGHGETDETVSMDTTAPTGFTYESGLSTPSASVAGDGSTALSVYFSRNKYDVTFNGVTTQEYYGATIVAPTAPEKTGYNFGGWSSTNVEADQAANLVDFTDATPELVTEAGASYYPYWIAAANKFNINGNYTDIDNVTKTFDADGQGTQGIESTTGNSIAIVSEIPSEPAANTTYVLYSDIAVPDGFKLDTASTSNQFTGTVAADGSTVLQVYYVRASYAQTFDAGEGTFSDGESTMVLNQLYGDTFAAPVSNPTREGYTFGGWTPAPAATVPAEAKTYTANWTAVDYTVTYQYTGTVPAGAPAVPTDATTNYHIGDTFTTKAPAEFPGYTFSGWAISGTGATLDGTTATFGAGNITLTGSWTVNKYNAIFMNGTEIFETQNKDFGETITAPAGEPTKEGHTFAGWSTDTTAENIVNFNDANLETMPVDGVTYNAIFTPNAHTVTYNTVKDGVTTQYTVVNYVYGETVVAQAAPPAIDGYTVSDWVWEGGAVTTIGDKDYVVTATYTPIDYAVSYAYTGIVPEGAPAAPTDNTVYHVGDEVTVIDASAFAGYTFSGWAADGITITDGKFIMPAAPVTLNGSWSASGLTVNYAYTGTVPEGAPAAPTDNTVYHIGETVNVAEAPTMIGYTLGEWTAADVTITNGSFSMPAESVTLTATWTINTHTAYFWLDAEKSDLHSQADFDFGEAISAPTPQVDGKTFVQWTPAVGEMDDEDIDFIAVFEDIEYIANFHGAESDDQITYYWGDTIDEAVPEAEGYTNDGKWYTDETYATEVTFPLTVNGDIVSATEETELDFYAKYTPISYDAVFYIGDNVYATVSTPYGQEISVPDDPTEEDLPAGYTFDMWDPDAVGVTMEIGGLRFDASLSAIDYDVTYSYTGDVPAGAADEPTSETANVGDSMTVAAAPTLEGYTFSGWTTTDATVSGGSYEMPAANVAFTGTWTPIDYAVSYAYTGTVPEGAPTAPAQVVKHIGDVVAVEADPELTGYTFNGWTTTDATVSNGSFTMPSKNVAFTGSWSAAGDIAYTVNTYTMGTDGGYVLAAETKYGTTGDGVDATPDAIAEGFSLNNETSTLTGTIAADGSLVLSVYIDRNTYTFTIMNDDETTTVSNYLYGATIAAPSTPAKVGYTFDKWVDTNGTTVTFPTTMPAGGLTVKAAWNANVHSAIFYINGDMYTTVSYDYGEAIAAPAYTAPEGYNFTTWVLDPATMGDADQNYYATLTPNTYRVSFSVDGTVVSGPTDTEFGAVIATPDTPTKEGYEFIGWYTAVSGGTPMPATMPAGDVTYYAVWGDGTNTRYTIQVYMMDTDGQYNLTASTAAYGKTGSTVAIEAVDPINGFTLSTQEPYQSIMSGTITPDGSLKLIAYYARNTYQVTFDGGEPIQVYYGGAISAPTPEAREGQVFTGWSPAVPNAMPANNIDFTSTWDAASYTITYVIDGAETVVAYDFGEAVATPDTPVKAGYEFTNWSMEIPATMPARNLRITAEFAIKSYQVQYRGFNNEIIAQYNIAYGDPIPVPSTTPSQPYYTFAGWTEIPATMPASNITILANFERVAVTLIPAEGSTTVIDRENYVIYGLKNDVTENELRNQFLDYTGDGRIELERTALNCFGTGAIVRLYDNLTGELLETYRIVIFGDVNGDARTTTDDVTVIQREALWTTDWSRVGNNYEVYTMMAADLNGDDRIGASDVTNARMLVLAAGEVDQATGILTPYIDD